MTLYTPINHILKLGITYTDYYDYGYYNPPVKGALITPTKIQSVDTNRGIFTIELNDKEKWRDRLIGEFTTFTNIDELALYNSGDEPLEFKNGDIVIIKATFVK